MAGARASSDLDIAGQEAQHPLLTEAPVERPDGLGMRGGFVGPLGGGAIGKQDQRTNDLIAPLELIAQPQRQLGKLCSRVHSRSFSRLAGRRAYVSHQTVFVTARTRGHALRGGEDTVGCTPHICKGNRVEVCATAMVQGIVGLHKDSRNNGHSLSARCNCAVFGL